MIQYTAMHLNIIIEFKPKLTYEAGSEFMHNTKKKLTPGSK